MGNLYSTIKLPANDVTVVLNNQCDQMARLFVQYLALNNNNFCKIA